MSADAKSWLSNAARANATVRPLPAAAVEQVAEPEDDGQEERDACRAYGGLLNRRDRAQTLEFRFLDAEAPDETLDYNFLARMQWRKGEGEIVLLYDGLGVKVVIRGLNLFELKERIRQHMVTWVQEQGSDELTVRRAREEAKMEGRELVLVEQIRVEERERGEEAGA